jgi:hypothetical protein
VQSHEFLVGGQKGEGKKQVGQTLTVGEIAILAREGVLGLLPSFFYLTTCLM